jgi:hypothetical protein
VTRRWFAVFVGCVIAAGARSIALGKDGNWDLKNYHGYNAWALFNGRMGWDLAPAQIQTYYNPVGDLPFYFLTHLLPWPRHVAFWMALSTAIAAFFLIRTLVLLFPVGRERGNIAWIVLAAAVGVTGAMGQATIGSTMNEWLSCAFLMAALWLVVRALVEGEITHPRAVAAAAFVLGCGAGLKLTYGIFAIGFLAGLLTWGTLRERARRVAIGGAFLAAGWAVFGGYWAWTMWQEFGNPTFPYYNHIFRSPWAEPLGSFDRNWGPRELLHWLFFPLYFSRQSLLVSEVGFRDYRLAALLVLSIAAAARFLAQRPRVDPAWRFLAAFTLASYLVWLKLFGIYRYLVPLEVLSGPLIVGCVLYLARGIAIRYAGVAILSILLIATTRPADWGRIPFGHAYFEVKAPELPPNSVVILGYTHPYAYLIPYFRADARFVSPANNLLAVNQENLLARRIAEVIRTHPGPIYLVELKSRSTQDAHTLRHFGLKYADEPCLAIRSAMADNYEQACPLRRNR